MELPYPGLDSWLVEKRLCRDRQSTPADELSGLADELLSPRVSLSQSAPADELSGLADELLSPRVSLSQSAPADEF